jgi:hypothetical protein
LGDGRHVVAIVRFGPWSRGIEARADHLAIAFHAGGRLLRSYSTLDIAGVPENVSRSVSHYSVLEPQVEGFVPDGDRMVFRVRTVDGRRLTFEPSTGA